MAATDGIFFDYDGQNGNGQQYSQSQQDAQSQHPRMPSWPPLTSTQHQHTQGMTVPTSSPQMNMNAYKRSSSPLPLAMGQQHPYQDTSAPAGQLMGNWQMGNVQMPPVTLGIDTGAGLQPSNFGSYGEMSFAVSPHDMMSQQQQAAAFMNQNANLNLDQNLEQDLLDSIGIGHQGLDVNNLAMGTSMPMDPQFMNVTSGLDMSNLDTNWHPVDHTLLEYEGIDVTTGHAFPQTHTISVGSPCDPASDIEVKSQSSSENSSWTWVDNINPPPTVFNPMAALHHRSPSDSSSDLEQPARTSIDSLDSYIDVGRQLNSPSESGPDSVYSDQGLYSSSHKPSPPPAILTAAASRAKQSVRKSPTSPTDRNNFKVTKPASNKAQPTISKVNRSRSGTTGTGEEKKRVGKRKGPLRPEQRKQASEIRKLGACIRCRFLKKTCDKGDPCAGCQPSHARLWLVPCTRVDIKDLGYFLKGWTADHERHVTLNVSVANLKGFGEHEKQLMVTHGYGHYLPIKAREVYVHDESVFGVDWIEAHSGTHEEFKVDTARLSIGMDGISPKMLSEYLDMHIDGGFEFFVDEHFQGTPFVTEMLKIAYRFYTKEKTPQVRKALKLVLAYNLTQAILLVRGFGAEEEIEGKIEDSRSEFIGETAAPMMINFKIKAAMAEMWRDLQKSLLEDLSQLYSSIYTGDKLKHWPTIFMVASVLLVVWEEMQFDCRYRVPDEKLVDKFCNDMETTPVGVIVGLFSAISQKVPSFSEWDTSKHHALLRSNPSVCEAMESVRDGIKKHDKYLRGRSQAKFDRNDFDSLSNMFVSKLVIRAH